jgi:alpha-tubulin suppressor-like RCC1 family protein
MGQLGNGSDQPSTLPVLVPHVVDAVDIRASRATTCVRMKTGAVSCWGDNAYGQANPRFDAALAAAPTPWGAYDRAGEPSLFTPANVLRVATANDVAAGARSLSLGYGHGCASDDTGVVKCWGDASRGQLGAGTAPDAFEVRTIGGLPRLVDVASALNYSCGRAEDGGVWCWGANEQGQLGSAEPGHGPRQVQGVAGAIAIQLAANRACATLRSGQVICWGDSLDCGEDHARAPAPAPELEKNLQFVRAAGECFWCALNDGHQLECDGDPIAKVHFRIPEVASVAAGIYHACAARSNGSVWCWGGNPNGELGRQPKETKEPEPAPVLWPPWNLERPTQ